MARKLLLTWESGNIAAASNPYETVTGSPTASNAQAHSGSYSMRCNPTAATAYIRSQFEVADSTGDVYMQFWIYPVSFTNALDTILAFRDTADATIIGSIRMNSNGTLELWDDQDAVQIGSDSSALNQNEWNYVELRWINSTEVLTARINGSQFATGAISGIEAEVNQIFLGVVTASTCDLYFDDVVITDNEYPGGTSLMVLRPNGNTANTPTTGSYADVDEVDQDGDTTHIEVDTAITVDFDVQSPSDVGVNGASSVKAVAVDICQKAESAAAMAYVARIVKGGSASESASQTHNDVTYQYNGDVAPRIQHSTLVDPSDSSAWTYADLATLQIGLRATDATPNIWVTQMYAIVEYVPTATVTYSQDTSAKANIPGIVSTSALASVGSIYTREARSSLPTNDANLTTSFTSSEVSDVSTSDDTRVAIAGGGWVLQEFKARNTNNTQPITISWEGQSSLAPTLSTVYLQIYNQTSASWETLDSDGATAADTDFLLEGTQTTSLSDYYLSAGGAYWVSIRVYQEVSN